MSIHVVRSIGHRLKTAKDGITTALTDEDIQRAMSKYKYDPARLKQGKALHATADKSVKGFMSKRGAQKKATAFANTSRKIAGKAYQDFAKVARAAFVDDPESLSKLGLDKAMPRRESDFLTAAQILFATDEYTEDMDAVLADNGYDKDLLAEESAKIDELDDAIQKREVCKGAHQQALQKQKSSLKALDKWMSCFTKVARVALADQPRAAGKLRIFTRSTKTAAQRKAPAKAAETRKKKKAAAVIAKAA